MNELYENKIIVLNRGNYTTCTINLHGATVTSWRIQNKEQLFVSRLSQFTYLSPIRGGITLVFPEYNKLQKGNQHGFSRNLNWSLEEGPTYSEDGDVSLLLSLTDDDFTHSLWHYEFKILLTITLYERKLSFNILVKNTSKYFPFEFDIVQRCKFRVPDVSKCEVIGLKGCNYYDDPDFENKSKEIQTEERDSVIISERTEKVYKNTANQLFITNLMDGGKLVITKNNLQDINLWNPWMKEKIENLGDDEHQYFISINPGVLGEKILLRPLAWWECQQTYLILEAKSEDDLKYSNFYDYFNDYC